jgi:hypothetical protein
MASKRSNDPEDLEVEKLRENKTDTLAYKIWVILCGNGKPSEGLVSKVDGLIEFKKRIEGYELEFKSFMRKILWCAVIGTSSVFFGFIYILMKDAVTRKLL